MKAIDFSPKLTKKLQKIRLKNRKLFLKIEKQLSLFQKDPKHKSLRLHKLKGDMKDVWSISIDDSYRLVYTENGEIYFFDIGTHDEVYRE